MKNKFDNLIETRFGGREKGNTFAFIMILLPLVMACFGLAIDIAVLSLTQTTLQSAADAATQSVIAQSRNAYSNNKPGLSDAEAKSEFLKYYDANRKGGYSGSGVKANNSPFLLCQGTTGGGAAVKSGCGFLLPKFIYSANGAADAEGSNIVVTVKEKSQTLFLRIIGISEFNYEITSKARLTQSFLPN